MANAWLKFSLLLFLPLAPTAKAGVTVVQDVAPGATSWPGSPILNTMANPSTANVVVCFTNTFATNALGQQIGGNTNMAQTFTILTTNYVLQQISIYAGGGSGTGVGTNLVLRLHDLGFQTGPDPAPYGGTPNETVVGNLLGAV